MKKYLFQIFIFCIPVLLVCFPLDHWFSSKLSKSKSLANGEVEVWSDIYNHNLNSNVLIYGSSRAWNHFDPMVLQIKYEQQIYNVGIDGYDFGMQYFRHQEILKHNNIPHTIILSLDVFMFENRGETYNSNQFLPFIFWNPDWQKQLNTYEGFGWTDYYFPLLRYSGLKMELKEIATLTLNNHQEPFRVNGFKAIDKEWNNDLTNARSKYEHGIIAKIDTNLLYLFNQFLMDCQKKNIKVILIFSPEYIEGQNFVRNRKAIFKVFQEMVDKFSLPYYNYSNSPICRDRSNFFNSNHLNKKGVDKFNQILLEDLPR
jgi:hypothetical protein